MVELLLLRHAQARNDDGPGDHERPLTARGLTEARAVGAWLAGASLRPDRWLVSPARRTRQTADLAAAALATTLGAHDLDPRLYLADVPALLDVLGDRAAGAGRVLIVAHNPGLHEFVEQLCDTTLPDDASGGAPFPPAALARIAINGGWEALLPGAGRLLQLWRGEPRGPAP